MWLKMQQHIYCIRQSAVLQVFDKWLWACRVCLVMADVDGEVWRVWSLWCWMCFWWLTVKWGTSSSGAPEPLHLCTAQSTFSLPPSEGSSCGVARWPVDHRSGRPGALCYLIHPDYTSDCHQNSCRTTDHLDRRLFVWVQYIDCTFTL